MQGTLKRKSSVSGPGATSRVCWSWPWPWVKLVQNCRLNDGKWKMIWWLTTGLRGTVSFSLKPTWQQAWHWTLNQRRSRWFAFFMPSSSRLPKPLRRWLERTKSCFTCSSSSMTGRKIRGPECIWKHSYINHRFGKTWLHRPEVHTHRIIRLLRVHCYAPVLHI